MKKIDKKMYSPNGGAKGVELADSASLVRANGLKYVGFFCNDSFEADVMKKDECRKLEHYLASKKLPVTLVCNHFHLSLRNGTCSLHSGIYFSDFLCVM